MATGRFRYPKTEAEEIALLSETVPKNTKYNSKCAVNVFTTWQNTRMNKKAQLEGTDLREQLSRTCQPHSSICPQRVYSPGCANSFVKWRSNLGNGSLLRRSTYLFVGK